MSKIINLFWYSRVYIEGYNRENLGDLLSKYLVEKISKKNIRWVYPKNFKRFFFYKINYLAIGSILSHANRKSIVWGSGIIKKDEEVCKATFISVRGPRTRQRLLDLGCRIPKIYGDPALLISNFYFPKIKKKYDYGIICHYVDYDDLKPRVENTKIEVINTLTNDIESKIDKILSCKVIISSSLHGVIIAHSYGIPAIWVKFSEKLYGDDIKFYDYFESVGLNYTEENFIRNKTIDVNLLNGLIEKHNEILLPDFKNINQIKESLLSVCPF